MYDEANSAPSVLYDNTMLCWVDTSMGSPACIPEDRSAPVPYWNPTSEGWYDQYEEPISLGYLPYKHRDTKSPNYVWVDPRTGADLSTDRDASVVPVFDANMCQWMDKNGAEGQDYIPGDIMMMSDVSPPYGIFSYDHCYTDELGTEICSPMEQTVNVDPVNSYPTPVWNWMLNRWSSHAVKPKELGYCYSVWYDSLNHSWAY